MDGRNGTPFEAWQAGHTAIVARELSGQPVPPAWERRLAALEAECRASAPPSCAIPGIAIGNYKRGDRGVYVGRRVGVVPASPFGNPFRPPDAIASYAGWLDAQLADLDSPQYRAWLDLVAAATLGPVTLVCWCVRRAANEARPPERWECHAEAVRDRLLRHLGWAGVVAPDISTQAALFDAPRRYL